MLNKAILILYLFARLTLQNRVLFMDVETDNATLPEHTINMSPNELVIKYYKHFNIHDIQITNMNDNTSPPKGNRTIPGQQLFTEGCHPVTQSLSLKPYIDITLPPLENEARYSDILTNPEKREYMDLINSFVRVYVVSTNYELNVITLEQDKTNRVVSAKIWADKVSFKHLLTGLIQNERDNPLFGQIDSFNYIITEVGGVSFTQEKISNNSQQLEISLVQQTQIYLRSRIYQVIVHEDLLLVAVGVDGVDVYQHKILKDGTNSLQSLFNIGKEFFGLDIDIRNIHIQSMNGSIYLSALDKNTGLYIFDLTEKQPKSYVQQIQMANAIKFGCFKNTFLVVQQSTNHVTYMSEIFVDFKNKDHFINQIFIEDINVRDIVMKFNYALILGSNTGIVLKHSVYLCNQQNSILLEFLSQKLISSFQANQINKMEDLFQSPSEVDGMHSSISVGLGEDTVTVYEVQDSEASIACYFRHDTDQQYRIRINATSCVELNDALQIKEDYFRYQCQLEHTLNIQVADSLLDSEQKGLIVGLVIGLLVLVIAITVTFCYCKRRWNLKLANLETRANELKAKNKYQEIPDKNEQQLIIKLQHQ